MQSSSVPAAQATSALDAAFAGSGFSTPTPHGDSARPYGNPHGSAAVPAAVADSKPPDVPMGVAEEKKEKRTKREGAWSSSPGAKPVVDSAGAATPVPASPRSASPQKGHLSQDGATDARLQAVELRLAAVEARFEGSGGLVEKLSAFAADVLAHRADAERRIEALAAAQQASVAEIDKVMSGKLAVIEAAFSRCDEALKELQSTPTAWPPGMPSSSSGGATQEPPSIALLRQRIDDLSTRAQEGLERAQALDDQLTGVRLTQNDQWSGLQGDQRAHADEYRRGISRLAADLSMKEESEKDLRCKLDEMWVAIQSGLCRCPLNCLGANAYDQADDASRPCHQF